MSFVVCSISFFGNAVFLYNAQYNILFYETKLRRTLLVFLLVILYYINIYGYNYDENMYMAVLSRTLVGYSFCILGNIFYKYYRNINTLTVFIGGVFLYGYLSMKVGVYGYSTLFNQYGNGDGKIISFFPDTCWCIDGHHVQQDVGA